MNKKIIIKNRRNNNERFELTLEEFKVKFHNELREAIDSYKKYQESKNYLPPYLSPTPDYEFEFYLDLWWNFNNFAQSQYYIVK